MKKFSPPCMKVVSSLLPAPCSLLPAPYFQVRRQKAVRPMVSAFFLLLTGGLFPPRYTSLILLSIIAVIPAPVRAQLPTFTPAPPADVNPEPPIQYTIS